MILDTEGVISAIAGGVNLRKECFLSSLSPEGAKVELFYRALLIFFLSCFSMPYAFHLIDLSAAQPAKSKHIPEPLGKPQTHFL